MNAAPVTTHVSGVCQKNIRKYTIKNCNAVTTSNACTHIAIDTLTSGVPRPYVGCDIACLDAATNHAEATTTENKK